MIKRIRVVHEERIIHRDIKPDNFLIGIEATRDNIYIIDFGLAKCYKNSEGAHIPFIEGNTPYRSPLSRSCLFSHVSGLLKEWSGSDGESNAWMKHFLSKTKENGVWQRKNNTICERLRWHDTCPAKVTRSFANSITKQWSSYVAAALVLKSRYSTWKSLLKSK